MSATGSTRIWGSPKADRIENIRRVGEVARLMADAGLIVMTAFISPFRAERDMVRAMMATGEFIEIFVDTPLADAEQRDIKGLYAKARAGQLANFTGIDSPYEPPLDPDLRIDTTAMTAEAGGRGGDCRARPPLVLTSFGPSRALRRRSTIPSLLVSTATKVSSVAALCSARLIWPSLLVSMLSTPDGVDLGRARAQLGEFGGAQLAVLVGVELGEIGLVARGRDGDDRARWKFSISVRLIWPSLLTSTLTNSASALAIALARGNEFSCAKLGAAATSATAKRVVRITSNLLKIERAA